MDKNKLEQFVSGYFREKPMLKKIELAKAIRNDFPNWSDATIDVRISELKKAGLVSNPARGVYAISEKPVYLPEMSSQLRKVDNILKRDFPFIRFCVWDTQWFNEFMRHQPFHYYLVAEVEKDVLEPTFYKLSTHFSKVFLNPDQELFDRYIIEINYPLILIPLVSESPIKKLQGISIPTIEKLLVDMLVEKNLFAAQQDEIEFIYRSVFEKYQINQFSMKRYATRRNRATVVEKLLTKVGDFSL